jgi:ferric-dicitrate binding protein FerR (iron transport regulator)
MSDTPKPSLDWQEQTARIDRALAEMGKLIEEQNKLRAEGRKLRAETGKLRSEKRRYNRDPWLIIGAAFVGAVGLIAARLPEIITAFHSH